MQLASLRPASLCGQRNKSGSSTSPARSGRPIVATRFASKRRTANPSGRRSSWRSREGQALRQTEAGQACQRRKIREQKDLPLGGGATHWTAGDLETSEESGRQESSEDQEGNGRQAYRIPKCFLRCRVDDRACTFQRLHFLNSCLWMLPGCSQFNAHSSRTL